MDSTLRDQLLRRGAEVRLAELRAELAILEELLSTDSSPLQQHAFKSERGRAQSERMKKYWAERKKKSPRTAE